MCFLASAKQEATRLENVIAYRLVRVRDGKILSLFAKQWRIGTKDTFTVYEKGKKHRAMCRDIYDPKHTGRIAMVTPKSNDGFHAFATEKLARNELRGYAYNKEVRLARVCLSGKAVKHYDYTDTLSGYRAMFMVIQRVYAKNRR